MWLCLKRYLVSLAHGLGLVACTLNSGVTVLKNKSVS
jgi:hypothetical protein